MTTDNIFSCNIRWKDDNTTQCVNIKTSTDYVEGSDEDNEIFFYCNSKEELNHLMQEDNGEDFVVTEIIDPNPSKDEVYTLVITQTIDSQVLDPMVFVFNTYKDARAKADSFINDEKQNITNLYWKEETDEWDNGKGFRWETYEDGYYTSNHTRVEIQRHIL